MAGSSEQPKQFWIRNDKGKMWGPLTFATIELLLDNGAMPGKLQASRNGVDFVWPGRLPDLRDALPKDLWGDSADPLPEEPAPASAAGPAQAGRPGPPRVGAAGQAPSGPPKVGAPAGPPKVGAPAGPPVVGKPQPKPAAVVSPASAAISKPAAKPAVPVADGEGVPATGSLDDFPPFRLYYLAASSGQTGRLTMNGIEASYEVFFKKGAPEAVSSSLDEEDLGSWLVSKGHLADAKLADARKMAGNFGGQLLNALFGLQLLNPAEAFKHIGEHALGLLTKAFTLEAGTFAFDASAAAPASAMPLGDRWKIICDMVRAIPVPDIRKKLGRRMAAPVVKSGGRVEISQLKLTPQEARAVALFDGVHSLDALCKARPDDADTLVRTAFLLFRFEAYSFADTGLGDEPEPEPEPAAAPEEPTPTLDLGADDLDEPPTNPGLPAEAPEPAKPPPPKAEPPKPAAARPAPAGPARPPPAVARPAGAKPPTVGAAPGKPVPPAPGTGTVVKPAVNPGKPPVVAAAAKPKPAAPAAAKPAAAPAAAPAGPAGANPGNDPVALKAFLEGMAGKNHFEVLGVPETAAGGDVKKAYFQYARWFHPDTAQGAPAEVSKLKADIFAKMNEANSVLAGDESRAAYLEELKAGVEKLDASKIFASEETFQKACILVKARKYPEALKTFDEAIALYDKEGEYHVWRGWARFLAAADKRGAKAEAVKEIDHGMTLSPRCAMGPYFKGQIHKLLGDGATAQKLFKETLELDPNHVEAQRETRQR